MLIVIALGFSMAIMISVPSGIMANQAATTSLMESYDKTIGNMEEEINRTLTLIECRTTSGFGQFRPERPDRTEYFLNESAISDVLSIQGVKDVVPFLEYAVGTSRTETRMGMEFTIFVTDYTIVGVPLNSSLIDNYSILPTNIAEGRNLREGDREVVLLSSNNTNYFGAEAGDEVNIKGSVFTVIGVYESADTRLYMSIYDAQTITDLEGKISRLDVYAEDESDVDRIASIIASIYPLIYITTPTDRLSQLERMKQSYQFMLQNAESTFSQTQTTAFQELIIAIVATGLIVLFTMTYTVRERTKEIGILKAIGLSNGNVMVQFLLEGVLLSLMAGVVGVVIGSMGAPFLASLLLPHINLFGMGPGAFSQSVTVTPNLQIILLAFGAVVLLGALGSLYPAWRASRTRPAEAMRYE